MKRLFALVLAALLCGLSYFFGTLNGATNIEAPSATWTNNNQAAQSWREWLVSLEAAGARIFSETEDPRERNQGLLYLAQLASASLEMKAFKGDPADPGFTDWMSDHRKFLGDSPDAVYHTAEISPDFQYLVSGNINEARYLGFMLYGRLINGWNRAADNRSLENLSFDEQGNFRLLLSREQPDDFQGDWLKLDDDIHMLMVRQYFHDRPNAQEAAFSIQTLTPQAYAPPTESQLATGFSAATRFFNESLSGNLALMTMLKTNANSIDPPKQYNPDFGGIFYPTPDNLYFGTWFSLNEGEALVIEGPAPDVEYWSISLQNQWMQSFDYRYHRTSLNNKDIKLNTDGSYRVVLSAEEIPEVNWISTSGQSEGLLSIRYQLATDTPAPTLNVVKISELKN